MSAPQVPGLRLLRKSGANGVDGGEWDLRALIQEDGRELGAEDLEHYAKEVNQKKLAASAILKWENAR